MIKEYFSRVSEALDKADCVVLEEIAWLIIETKKSGARIFTAGNGGSAATASHFVNDLIKGCQVYGRAGFNATCLCDALPVLTCLANDFSYEDVFVKQLQTMARSGDVLILFSGSGNSPNILRAAEYGAKLGMEVIAFSGRDGGALESLCGVCVIAYTWGMEEIEDLHLCYCHSLVTFIREKLKDCWDIEIINYPRRAGGYKYALFDFDGTVSLLREGWQGVMVPYFIETLAAAGGETPSEDELSDLKDTVTEFVDILTGKQTIFQCMRLDEEVQKRGGPAVDPYIYKAEYLRRLKDHIHKRHEDLREGKAKPKDYLVPGCVEFFELLRSKNIKLYLASGTDETDVIAEAELLGVAKYFDGGIYGAFDEQKKCTKEVVVEKILKENKIHGSELVSFGDGFVEIELTKKTGGYAVAVASDETRRKGVNEWKRKRLLSAGADAVAPDFADFAGLYKFLTGKGNGNAF